MSSDSRSGVTGPVGGVNESSAGGLMCEARAVRVGALVAAPWSASTCRIDRHFSFEQHGIHGIPKLTTRVGSAIAVMLAMALGHIRRGRPQQLRSRVRSSPATG
jgi:hypothetical protein